MQREMAYGQATRQVIDSRAARFASESFSFIAALCSGVMFSPVTECIFIRVRGDVHIGRKVDHLLTGIPHRRGVFIFRRCPLFECLLFAYDRMHIH